MMNEAGDALAEMLDPQSLGPLLAMEDRERRTNYLGRLLDEEARLTGLLPDWRNPKDEFQALTDALHATQQLAVDAINAHLDGKARIEALETAIREALWRKPMSETARAILEFALVGEESLK